MNIIAPILFQCKLNPLALAIHVPGAQYGSVTYGMLERLIHNAARMAEKSGIMPGSVVAVYVADTVLHIVLSLALMHAGVATLSLRGPRLVAGIGTDVVLTDVPGQISGEATILSVDESWLSGDSSPEFVTPSRNGEDICRIILTSGSTGISKGVALSHRAMAERTMNYATLRGSRFAHCPRFFCDLNLSTSPGIHYLLAVLGRGAAIHFLGPDPTDILQIIGLHDIKGMATSPYGLGEFLRFFEADSAFDTTFDHVICQGALLSQELSHRARARICQNLYTSYGATETSTVAFGPATLVERTPRAVGYVQPDALMEAVDESDRVLPRGTDGLLRIRTPYMASGYVGDPALTAQIFRGGYFYTGDLGHITTDGVLVVTGRQKSAFNIGGDTVSAERIEEAIVSFPGVREAGAFALDNELGIAELHALIVTDVPIDEDALRRHCSGQLPPSCTLMTLTRVDRLPRAEQGKLERARFPELAANQKDQSRRMDLAGQRVNVGDSRLASS